MKAININLKSFFISQQSKLYLDTNFTLYRKGRHRSNEIIRGSSKVKVGYNRLDKSGSNSPAKSSKEGSETGKEK